MLFDLAYIAPQSRKANANLLKALNEAQSDDLVHSDVDVQDLVASIDNNMAYLGEPVSYVINDIKLAKGDMYCGYSLLVYSNFVLVAYENEQGNVYVMD